MAVEAPVRPPRPEPAPGPQPLARLHKREARTGLLFILPAVLLLTLFLVVPVVLAFSLGFTDTKLSSPNPAKVVGTDNFERLLTLKTFSLEATPPAAGEEVDIYDSLRQFTRPGAETKYEGLQVLRAKVSQDGQKGDFVLAGDALFWKSLKNTLFFSLVIVPLQGGLGLLLALLVNTNLRGRTFFRTVYFFPVVTSMVVVSILWTFLYQDDGLINVGLQAFIPGWEPINFLSKTSTALPAIIFMSAWQGVGFHMIIWLAGLQTIPQELYEAARVDGANVFKRFRYVTWPGLNRTFVFVLVTITIASLGLFTQINIMTQGGPLDSTTTIIFHAFREGWGKQQIGYSSAIAVVFFMMVMAISLIQRRLTRERD
jgi:multiple sugar transport system permease protein